MKTHSAGAQELFNDYPDEAHHAAVAEGAFFRPVSYNRTGKLKNAIAPDGVYKLVSRYALGLKIGAQAPRAKAATNALDQDADSTIAIELDRKTRRPLK